MFTNGSTQPYFMEPKVKYKCCTLSEKILKNMNKKVEKASNENFICHQSTAVSHIIKSSIKWLIDGKMNC